MTDTFAMAELLRGEYRETFEQIALYGDMSELNEQFVEDRVLNIYDLLMEAQKDERPVEKIVGTDLKQFCEEYFSPDEKGFWTKEVFKRIFRVSVIMLVLVFIDCIIYYTKEGAFSLQRVSMTAKPFVVGTIVAAVLMFFGKFVREKLMFGNSKVKPILYYIIAFLIFALGIGFGTVALDRLDLEISVLPVMGICGGYCLIYLIAVCSGRYRKHGSLKDPDKPSREEKAEKKAIQKEISMRSEMISNAREMEKRYRKLRAKNEKKGKPEYTMVDFAKLIKKETNLKLYKPVFVAVPSIATVRLFVSVGSSENMKLAVLVAGVFAVVMYFMWRFIWNVCTEVFVAQRTVIEECENRGIDIVEYVSLQDGNAGEGLPDEYH